MSLRRVGPEQVRQLLFHASVVTKRLMKILFPSRLTSPEWSENEIAFNSGRFILSELRRTKTCHQSCRTKRIPALARRARKREAFAINLIPLAGLVATSFDASVDAHHKQDKAILSDGSWDLSKTGAG